MKVAKKALLALTLLVTGISAAEEVPRMPLVGETIQVSIINLDVIVTDRKGKRIQGLRADDFEVVVGGVPQVITHFAEYGSRLGRRDESELDPVPPESSAPDHPRTIVLFIDEKALAGQRDGLIFSEVRKFLRTAVRPGDSVAVISWAGRLITRQDYTDDVEALVISLDGVADRLPPPSSYRMDQTTHEEAYFRMLQDELARGRADGSRVVGGFSGQQLEAAQRAYSEMKRKVEALEAVLSSMAGGEGQKVLLLITHRFSRIAGQEFLLGLRTSAGPLKSGELQYDARPLLESMARHANACGVTIHGLYARGTDVELPGAASNVMPLSGDGTSGVREQIVAYNEMEALSLVAERTGGLADMGKTGAELFSRIGTDLSTYYSLAYRLTDSFTGGVRKIVVRTKDRAYRVRTRREFVARSDEARMKDRVLAHLFRSNGINYSTIGLRTEFGPRRTAGKDNWLIPVRILIPVAALTSLPEENHHIGSFSVYIATAGILGTEGKVTERRQKFKVPADRMTQAHETGFVYDFELLLDQVTDRVSIGVRDDLSGEYGLLLVLVPAATNLQSRK